MYYYNNYYRPVRPMFGYMRNFADGQEGANAGGDSQPRSPEENLRQAREHAKKMREFRESQPKNSDKKVEDLLGSKWTEKFKTYLDQYNPEKRTEERDRASQELENYRNDTAAGIRKSPILGRIRGAWRTFGDLNRKRALDKAEERLNEANTVANYVAAGEGKGFDKALSTYKTALNNASNDESKLDKERISDKVYRLFRKDIFGNKFRNKNIEDAIVSRRRRRAEEKAYTEFMDDISGNTGFNGSRPRVQTADAIRINFARKHAALTHAYVLGYTRNFASPGEQVAGAYVQPLTNSAVLANNAITAGNTLLTGAGRMARDVLPVGGAIAGTIPGGMIGGMVGALAANAIGSQDPLVDFLTLGGGTAGGMLTGGVIGNRVGQFLSNRYFPAAAPVPMVVPAQPVVAAK